MGRPWKERLNYAGWAAFTGLISAILLFASYDECFREPERIQASLREKRELLRLNATVPLRIDSRTRYRSVPRRPRPGREIREWTVIKYQYFAEGRRYHGSTRDTYPMVHRPDRQVIVYYMPGNARVHSLNPEHDIENTSTDTNWGLPLAAGLFTACVSIFCGHSALRRAAPEA